MALHENANQRVATEGHPYIYASGFEFSSVAARRVNYNTHATLKKPNHNAAFTVTPFEVPNGRVNWRIFLAV